MKLNLDKKFYNPSSVEKVVEIFRDNGFDELSLKEEKDKVIVDGFEDEKIKGEFLNFLAAQKSKD